jgi:hypothetical protein
VTVNLLRVEEDYVPPKWVLGAPGPPLAEHFAADGNCRAAMVDGVLWPCAGAGVAGALGSRWPPLRLVGHPRIPSRTHA